MVVITRTGVNSTPQANQQFERSNLPLLCILGFVIISHGLGPLSTLVAWMQLISKGSFHPCALNHPFLFRDFYATTYQFFDEPVTQKSFTSTNENLVD